jgi:hypothetical protein
MPSTRFRLPVLALAGSLGFAAAWILLADVLGRPAGWMAPLAALDAALLLRLAGRAGGPRRAAWGVVATALAVAVANWGIVAVGMGRLAGIAPPQSLWHLGASHGWLLLQLANGAVEVAWWIAGLVVAAVACR